MRLPLYSLLALSTLLPACDAFIGSIDRYGDDVDVSAAKAAFDCASPSSAGSKRACEAIANFEKAGKVEDYPVQGETIYMSRRECSEPGADVHVELVALMPGTPPGEMEEAFRAPGSLSETTMVVLLEGEGVDEAVTQVLSALSEGKPAPTTSLSTLPESWDGWKKKWSKHKPKAVRTAQSAGTSLLEGPSELTSSSAYWRESDGVLLRLQPPFARGWCVNRYVPIP